MTRTAHSTRLRMLLGTLARSFLLVGLTGCPWVSPDVHGDRVADASGNCPNDPNPDQSGVDEDGIGDVCDPSPETRVIPDCPNDPDNDADGDGICGDVDNCPAVLNADQTDSDSDGVGDACDGCPNDRNKIEPGHCGCSEPDTDTDGDGKPDCRDNCPDVPNPGQEDEDGDCVGDACDECSDTPAGMKVDSRGCRLPKEFGLAYGPFRQHESPTGLQPTLEEVQEDLVILEAILPPPGRIRIYSATQGNRLASVEAFDRGFTVTLGAWVGSDPAANQEEIAALIEIANTYPLAAVVVGNEAILRGDVSVGELVGLIQQVRDQIPAEIPVGTAEPWSVWAYHEGAASLADASDILLVHVHPFWESLAIDEAVPYVFQRLDEVANLELVGQGKRVVLGETGWPSDGVQQGAAIPSETNQARFVREFLSEQRARKIDAFFFSTFDEPWKGIAEREEGSGGGSGGDDVTNEGPTGAHWGLFRWNRRLKAELTPFFPEPPEPTPATLEYRVFCRGTLSPGHDMGLDSSGLRRDWLQISEEALRLSYPAGQCWGSVFITYGEPTPTIPRPNHKDLHDFEWLALEIKGETGREEVELAVKDNTAPDDGTEPKVRVSDLQTDWQSALIPLADFDPMDRSQLYVTASFNFLGTDPVTVFVRNIRYVPLNGAPPEPGVEVSPVVPPQTAEGDLFVDGCLSRWYVIGLDTSGDVRDWMEPVDGALRLSYPALQSWGAMFMAVRELVPQRPRPFFQDFSSFRVLSFEARGEEGGEFFDVGTKDRYAPDTGRETKVGIGPLSTTWQRFEIPLSQFVGTNMAELYVPFEVVFEGSAPRTIFVREIRYER